MDRERIRQSFPYSERDAFDSSVIRRLSQEITLQIPSIESGLLLGSAATGGFDEARSDFDLVFVLSSGPSRNEKGVIRLQRIRDIDTTLQTIEAGLIDEGLAKPHHFSGRPIYLDKVEITPYLYPFLSRIVVMIEAGVFKPFVGKDFKPYLPSYGEEELMEDTFFNMCNILQKTKVVPPFISTKEGTLKFITKRAVYFLRMAQLGLFGKVVGRQVDILEGAAQIGDDWEKVIPTILQLFDYKFVIPEFPVDAYRTTLINLMHRTLEAMEAKGITLSSQEREVRTLMLQLSRTTDKQRKVYLTNSRDAPTLARLMTGEGYVDVGFAYQDLRRTLLSLLYPEDLYRLTELENVVDSHTDIDQLPSLLPDDPLRIFFHGRIIPYLPVEDKDTLNKIYENWYAPAIEDFLRWYFLNRADRLKVGLPPVSKLS